MPSSVWDAIPKTGFFPEYVNYAASVTDAPLIYHVASSLAMYSTVVSGKAELKFDVEDGAIADFPLHLWVLVLGKSGGRKSAAAERPLKLFDDYIGERGPTGGSPESFYSWISEHPTCLFFFTEMAALFGLQQASYWQQAQTLFNELYDGNDFKRTLQSTEKNNKGKKKVLEIEIKRPRVTLLGCATPSLLDTSTRDVDWTGGMIGRMMLFHDERTELNIWPNLKRPDAELALKGHMEWIKAAISEKAIVDLTSAAKHEYEVWVRELDATIEQYPERTQPLITRLPQHVLRVAGLYALSTGCQDVDANLMSRAINLGDISKDTVIRVGKMLTPDRVARLVKLVRQRLLEAPNYTLSVRDVLENLNIAWKTLEPAYKSLWEAGEVAIMKHKASGRKWMVLVDVPKAQQQVAYEEPYYGDEEAV